jgi:hypothetical protein
VMHLRWCDRVASKRGRVAKGGKKIRSTVETVDL